MIFPRSLFWVVLSFFLLPAPSDGAGSIQLANTSLTAVMVNSSGGLMQVPAGTRLRFGVFWGATASGQTLATPMVTNSVSSPGLISFPGAYLLPGTAEGQQVYLQVRGWPAEYGDDWMAARFASGLYGETDVRLVTLGPGTGPGTVIWQGVTGTSPSRFRPLVLGSILTPPLAYVTLGVPPDNAMTIDVGTDGVVEAVVPVVRQPVLSGLDFSTTVTVATTNQSAVAGVDYTGGSTSVTFGPGEIQKYVRVPVYGRMPGTGGDRFGLWLSSGPVNTSLDNRVFGVQIRLARVAGVEWREGQWRVRFPTSPRQRYAVEVSTDLENWSVVPGAETVDGLSGEREIEDPGADCCAGARFYRTRLLPWL